MLLSSLKEKAILKQDVAQIARESFTLLKTTLREIEKDLKRDLAGTKIEVEYRDRGDFGAEFKVAEDTLIFLLHSNVFTFHQEHGIWKTSYAQKNYLNLYCGMISMYNFLSDSFSYRRENDIGYLVARLFVNVDRHYFVEGKSQMGFLYNDFNHSTVTRESMRRILESVVSYTQDFDLLVPPYEEISQVSVGEVLEVSSSTILTTGKRLGFRFSMEEVTEGNAGV
jgi:hypothetical protein